MSTSITYPKPSPDTCSLFVAYGEASGHKIDYKILGELTGMAYKALWAVFDKAKKDLDKNKKDAGLGDNGARDNNSDAAASAPPKSPAKTPAKTPAKKTAAKRKVAATEDATNGSANDDTTEKSAKKPRKARAPKKVKSEDTAGAGDSSLKHEEDGEEKHDVVKDENEDEE